MKKVVTSCLALVLAASAWGQQQQPSSPAPDQTAQQLKALAEQVKAQQRRIERLEQQLQQALSNRQEVAHAPNLGTVASTAPVLPPAREANLRHEAQGTSEKAPTPSDAIVLKAGKLRIGAVGYGQWGAYYQTGFGPAFYDSPTTYPGPGNDGYNAFDITRAYLNFQFSPTDWVTFRITPDIYRDINNAPGQKLSGTSATGATPNGSLNFRLKYAYAEFKPFSGTMKDNNIRFGQQVNPLIDWEEALYGYRFASLVPWNFISLSSTYTGLSLNGPLKWNGKQYLDYQIGVFNNSNFHQLEQAETKSGMARVSFYPLGASSRFQGLGLTGFVDYGYTNSAPEALKTPVMRTAALVHYQSAHDGGQIALEYDWGRNAFSTGNLYGGSAPADLVGLGTTQFAGLTALSKSILAGRNTKQQGFAAFGHINIPNTKWAFFGTYQFFQPNTDVPRNPLDFHRTVAGISYRVNPHVRLALDSQNVLYRRSQFTYPAADIALFDPALAAANPGGIPDAVPKSVKAIFANMEFVF